MSKKKQSAPEFVPALKPKRQKQSKKLDKVIKKVAKRNGTKVKPNELTMINPKKSRLIVRNDKAVITDYNEKDIPLELYLDEPVVTGNVPNPVNITISDMQVNDDVVAQTFQEAAQNDLPPGPIQLPKKDQKGILAFLKNFFN